MLWDRNGWMKRTDAIASLKENFETMQSPLLRNKFISKAAESKKFFFAKGPWGQTLGLTIEDAHTALDIAYPSDVEAPATSNDTLRPPLEGIAEMAQDENAEEVSAETDIEGGSSLVSEESLSTQESVIENEADS
jgi:hypothetical protein